MGRIGSGVIELVAGILLLVPSFALYGAVLSILVSSGAIVSHLAILGIEIMGDRGLLFALALTVFCRSLGIVYLRRGQLLPFVARLRSEARP